GATGVAAAVVLIAGAWWWRSGRAPRGGTPSGLDPHRLAVLYFDDLTPTKELQFVADGFTEALIHELSAVSALQVISRNGVVPFRNARASADSIARALKVGT